MNFPSSVDPRPAHPPPWRDASRRGRGLVVGASSHWPRLTTSASARHMVADSALKPWVRCVLDFNATSASGRSGLKGPPVRTTIGCRARWSGNSATFRSRGLSPGPSW
jgi:hypothetical protein